ncbi:dienelactone hydrolase family protein [Modestobacter altitudinis]|uniref:dienelactone hydrolase family protein n=1 Tax=Modestobacter altitudinis TaxID=2213158 RepID=UPI00110D146D|nr:dienelactone hydrolase family protein [Modestobacter altitudinis]
MTSPARTALADQVGYLAVPVVTSDRPGPWPGVVLVHDVLGLGDDMREQADWLAAAGYLVAVPDLYEGKAAIRCLKSTFAHLSRQQGPTFDRLDATRSALADDPRCTSQVGVIGYCMGGGFALLLAGRPGWSAASVNYGPVPDDVDDVLSGACPVVASFGGRDKGLKGAAEKVRAAADAAGVPADVKEYPEARHGFINRISAAWPLTPVLKVAGVGYDHDAAADAKRRILAFFDEHLRTLTSPG